MRIVATLALAFAFALAGCLGAPNVRAVLIEETITLDANAPQAARDRVDATKACASGQYDAATRTIMFEPHELAPTFAVIRNWGDGYSVLSARGDGPLGAEFLASFGTSGTFGWSGPFRDPAEFAELRYDRVSVSFNGVPLQRGETVPFRWEYNSTLDNAWFGVQHTIHATYLGRVAFEEKILCGTT